MSMASMGAVQIIAVGQGRRDPGGDAFLTDADMDQPGEFLFMAEVDDPFFETADQPHALKHVPV
jgi:hypothetical protein